MQSLSKRPHRTALFALFSLAVSATYAISASAQNDVDSGIKQLKAGQFATAITKLQHGLKLDPENVLAHYYLGEAYDRQGNIDAAVRHYRLSIAYGPDSLVAADATARIDALVAHLSADRHGHVAASTSTAADARYEIHDDTVYDTTANLTWARCSVGQHWQNTGGCVGVTSQLTWDDAQLRATGTWRLPTRDEMSALLDQARAAQHQKPTIDEVAFPNMDLTKLWYWTSTPNNPSLTWLVGFDDGDVLNGNYVRGSAYSVRLVRSGR